MSRRACTRRKNKIIFFCSSAIYIRERARWPLQCAAGPDDPVQFIDNRLKRRRYCGVFGIHGFSPVGDRVMYEISPAGPGGVVPFQHGELGIGKQYRYPVEIGLVEGNLPVDQPARNDRCTVIEEDESVVEPGYSPGPVVVKENSGWRGCCCRRCPVSKTPTDQSRCDNAEKARYYPSLNGYSSGLILVSCSSAYNWRTSDFEGFPAPFLSGRTSSRAAISPSTFSFVKVLRNVASSAAFMIMMPFFFIGRPLSPTGLMSMASDAARFLVAGSRMIENREPLSACVPSRPLLR